MKPISVHVPEQPYQQLKSLAARRGKPVAALLREAMLDYLSNERRSDRSILDLPAHDSGRLKKGWNRAALADEMRGKRPA